VRHTDRYGGVGGSVKGNSQAFVKLGVPSAANRQLLRKASDVAPMRAQPKRRASRRPRCAAPLVPVELVIDGLAGFACFTVDPAGLVTSWSESAHRMFGHDADAVVGRHLRTLHAPGEDLADEIEHLLDDALSCGRAHHDARRRCVDGRELPTIETVTALRDDDQALLGFVVVAQDVSGQHEAAERWRAAHARSAALLEHWRGAALLVDRAGLVSYATSAFADWFGLVPSDLVGRPLAALVRAVDAERLRAVLATLEDPDQRTRLEVRLQLHADGFRDVRLELCNKLGDVDIAAVLVNAYDVAGRPDEASQLRWEAEHDPLTSLPNRAHLLARLRTPTPVDGDLTRAALMVIDLDNFKLVNDAMGHYSGDHLLMELAARLVGVVRADDTVARLGGDEFGVLVAGPLWPGQAEALAERVRLALAEPVELIEGRVTVTASVGVVHGHDCHHTEMFQAADTALHLAKDLGRNRVEVFHRDLLTKVHRRVEDEQSLRQALDAGEMIVYYQPVVDLVTQRVVSAEALLRIRDAQGNASLPASLIGVAEETGLIVPIGLVVLADACRQLNEWRRDLGDLAPQRVAVNLSPRQLESKGLAAAVERILREHGVEPGTLCLEITESTVISPDQTVVDNVRALHEIGVPLVIDDFGTGYSGLAYLSRFPVSGVKIDRSFVSDIVEDRSKEAIVRAVVAMAGSLGLYVVAEGVEQPAQREALLDLGCHQGQGWLWAKAVAGPAMADEVRRLAAVLPA
jgi:diguanylate cyclase (GGDEF)-like protein/PAS domain S-box-containing protein